jgi:RNA polymerase sigma-70 factor, ECF subfamily
MVGSGPDREDLLQEVFLQLHRSLPTFRGAASLATFLHCIIRNVAIDYLRRRARHLWLAYDNSAGDFLADTAQDPEQQTGSRLQLRTLLDQLDRLPKKKRDALVLRVVVGLPLRQTASYLGTSPAAVKQQLTGARRDLTGKSRSPSRPASRR